MNRIVALAAAAIAAILLAGCYESNELLLDVSAARQPITSYGDWRFTSGGLTYHARLNPRSDGWYDYDTAMVNDDGTEGEWEHQSVLLNYLESTAGMDVYVAAVWDDMESAYIYALVAFLPGGGWQTVQPDCDMLADDRYIDIDAGAASSAGAELSSNDMADICIFRTRDSLFSAMRAVAEDPGFRQRVDDASK